MKKVSSLTPKSSKYAALEQKPIWRLLKVIYVIAAISIAIGFINGSLNRIDNCKMEHVVRGTKMIQNAIQRNIDNGTACSVYKTQVSELLIGIIVLLALYAGFLLLRDIMSYVIFGSKKIE